MGQRFANPAGQGRDIATKGLGLWHLASLDAPTVAVVWSLAFAWSVNVRLPMWVPMLLFLVVWPVYVGDRLLDARSALRKGQTGPLRHRHWFHWRYRRVLTPLAVAAAIAATAIILDFMPNAVKQRDSVLALAALVYMTRVHARPSIPRPMARLIATIWRKEFLVGLLFTIGCALPAIGRSAGWLPRAFWPAAAFFVLLAWGNCHAIERWETETARVNAGRRSGFDAPLLLALAGVACAGALAGTEPRLALLFAAGALSALLLAALHGMRRRLDALTLRAAADVVLLAPALLLLLPPNLR